MSEEVKDKIIEALMERDNKTKIEVLTSILEEIQKRIDEVNHDLCLQRNAGDERYFRGRKEALEGIRRNIEARIAKAEKLREENK